MIRTCVLDAQKNREEKEDLTVQKNELRKRHKRLRNQMTQEEREEKSREICSRLLQSDWYAQVQVILGYYPLGTEVDCLPFLYQALSDGKRVALPRCGTFAEYKEVMAQNMQMILEEKQEEPCAWMDFFEVQTLKQVTEGAFHVMEPQAGSRMIFPEEKQSVILVPGVLFDRTGNRCGYGMGYYDRYFFRYPNIRRFALAYENQFDEKLPVTETDVRMHRIYSERTVCLL